MLSAAIIPFQIEKLSKLEIPSLPKDFYQSSFSASSTTKREKNGKMKGSDRKWENEIGQQLGLSYTKSLPEPSFSLGINESTLTW